MTTVPREDARFLGKRLPPRALASSSVRLAKELNKTQPPEERAILLSFYCNLSCGSPTELSTMCLLLYSLSSVFYCFLLLCLLSQSFSSSPLLKEEKKTTLLRSLDIDLCLAHLLSLKPCSLNQLFINGAQALNLSDDSREISGGWIHSHTLLLFSLSSHLSLPFSLNLSLSAGIIQCACLIG